MLENRVLQYFIVVAEELNISRAAKILHVTQPTLSRQLKMLEEELGVVLFERKSYSIELTKEGQILKQRAREIIDIIQKTTQEVTSIDDLNHSEIFVGAAETTNVKYVGRAMQEIRKKSPDILVHLYSGNNEYILDRLEDGLLNIAIVSTKPKNESYEFFPLPVYEPWGVLMRKDSPLARKSQILREDLVDLPLLCSREALKQDLKNYLQPIENQISIVGTYDLLYNASIMVREKEGYALCYYNLLDTRVSASLCIRPLYPSLETQLFVVWRKNKDLTPIMKILTEQIKQELITIRYDYE